MSPFSDCNHQDPHLFVDILNGLRPDFSENTPDFFVDLTTLCVDGDPKKRPTIEEIEKQLFLWKCCFDEKNVLNLDGKFTDGEIKKMKRFKKEFDKMDKMRMD